MNNFIGISVTKDLACIAVMCVDPYGDVPVAFIDDGGLWGLTQTVHDGRELVFQELSMFTFSDGRAFRSIPYFNRWKPEFILHDGDIDEIAFGRALADTCEKWGTQIVGYDPAQNIKLISRRALPITKDSQHSREALHLLNMKASQYSGLVFAENSAAQWMWESLPRERVIIGKQEETERVFPHGELVARGRYDAVHTVTNAIAAGIIVKRNGAPWLAEEKAESDRLEKERQRQESEQQKIMDARVREIEEYWESLPAHAQVYIRHHDHALPEVVSMSVALPLLKQRRATFVSMAPGWEHLAWRGFTNE
jgi:hypothetical protein